MVEYLVGHRELRVRLESAFGEIHALIFVLLVDPDTDG
jgi:hypothetical protein